MFRFTIRDLLWFTLVVGLTAAWWKASARFSELSERTVRLRAIYGDLVNSVQGKGITVTGDPERGDVGIQWHEPAQRGDSSQ